jgi:hypothetical protein
MKLRKSKSDMTSSEEYTGRRVFQQESLLFERGCHPLYEETCLSLPFQKQNGVQRNRSKDYQENMLRISGADILAGEKGKMRKNRMGKKNNLCTSDERERQKIASLNSMEPGNRGNWASPVPWNSSPFPFYWVEVPTLYLSEPEKGL